ncbi:MAG: hypothetical protein QOF66_770 [Mycobacterium sp.]|nr:hypothetical protein [Mycobacterium sp.]
MGQDRRGGRRERSGRPRTVVEGHRKQHVAPRFREGLVMTDLPTRATIFTSCADAPAVSLQPLLGAGAAPSITSP